MCLLVLLELYAFRKLPESMEEALNIGGKTTHCIFNASIYKIAYFYNVIAKDIDFVGTEGNSRGFFTCTCLSPAEMFRW